MRSEQCLYFRAVARQHKLQHAVPTCSPYGLQGSQASAGHRVGGVHTCADCAPQSVWPNAGIQAGGRLDTLAAAAASSLLLVCIRSAAPWGRGSVLALVWLGAHCLQPCQKALLLAVCAELRQAQPAMCSEHVKMSWHWQVWAVLVRDRRLASGRRPPKADRACSAGYQPALCHR